MKKIILCSLFSVFVMGASAQIDTLAENFNLSCASASGFPIDWTSFTPVPGTGANGVWQCAPTNGRYGTPGIECDGIWSATYHLDTSYLISPALNLSGYADAIYLNFDTKTTNIYLGGRLSIMLGNDTNAFGRSLADTTNLTPSMLPVFTNNDSSGWVTHQVDLSAYKGDVPLYIAFMYTSTTTSGSIWYLDNINVTTVPLHVSDPVRNTLPLSVIGNSSSSQITLSYKTTSAGTYHLVICNILGHKAYEEDINNQGSDGTCTITGLNLHSGMYIIKMGNGAVYGTTKTIVP